MLFQCKACGPATDHGSAPKRSGKAKPWRTIDIHCHCMVPEANAMVLKATGHSRRRRNAERQRPCQRAHQKHPAAARQDRFSETDRSRHPPCRHGPRRHRRAGDLALSRPFRLCRAAGSGARQLPHGQRPHRRHGGETPRPADGHGHRAAAGPRHGRRRARTAPSRSSASAASNCAPMSGASTSPAPGWKNSLPASRSSA